MAFFCDIYQLTYRNDVEPPRDLEILEATNPCSLKDLKAGDVFWYLKAPNKRFRVERLERSERNGIVYLKLWLRSVLLRNA